MTREFTSFGSSGDNGVLPNRAAMRDNAVQSGLVITSAGANELWKKSVAGALLTDVDALLRACASPVPPGEGTPSGTSDQMMAQAKKFATDGEADKAERWFRATVDQLKKDKERRPDVLADAYENLAVVQQQQNKFSEAVASYKLSISASGITDETDLSNGRRTLRLADLYTAMGQHRDAQPCYEAYAKTARARKDEDPASYNYSLIVLARNCCSQRDYEGALNKIDEALKASDKRSESLETPIDKRDESLRKAELKALKARYLILAGKPENAEQLLAEAQRFADNYAATNPFPAKRLERAIFDTELTMVRQNTRDESLQQRIDRSDKLLEQTSQKYGEKSLESADVRLLKSELYARRANKPERSPWDMASDRESARSLAAGAQEIRSELLGPANDQTLRATIVLEDRGIL